MSLIKKMYKNINLEEDLKNMLNSIKVEVNKLEGFANKNGSRKELNKNVHKLNELRILAENCYLKAKNSKLDEVTIHTKRIIKKIRKVESNLFHSIKNGNYYNF